MVSGETDRRTIGGASRGQSPAAGSGQEAARRLLQQSRSSGPADPLHEIEFIQGAASELEAGQRAAARRAREAGRTWAEIGQVLGITRQAAFQRFGRPVDPRTHQPMAEAMLSGAANRGEALFADLVAGRWAEFCRDFDDKVAGKLDPDGLARAWAAQIGAIGQFERMGRPVAYPAGDYTLVDVPLFFEAGERTGRITFDRAGKIAGLFFLRREMT